MTQKTFLMLKPDAYDDNLVDIIIKELESKGLKIESSVELNVDIDIMKTLLDHYHEVIDRMDPSFNYVGKLFNTFYYFGSKKIRPMIVTYDGTEDIIDLTRTLVGKTSPVDADPNSIRGKYSTDSYDKAGEAVRLVQNLVHASDSHESVEREIGIWSKYFK